MKITALCAALGFTLPLILLAFWAMSDADVSRVLFALCPTSLASMALDHSSTSMAITVWFFICLSNAILYAALPAVILLFLHLFRPKTKPPSILK